jgi:hypothetical protein
MIRVRFSSPKQEFKALGFLAGRFSFKTFKGGEMIVPAAALPAMADEGIRFTVEGRASYEQIVPAVRGAVAPRIQRRKTGARRAHRSDAA